IWPSWPPSPPCGNRSPRRCCKMPPLGPVPLPGRPRIPQTSSHGACCLLDVDVQSSRKVRIHEALSVLLGRFAVVGVDGFGADVSQCGDRLRDGCLSLLTGTLRFLLQVADGVFLALHISTEVEEFLIGGQPERPRRFSALPCVHFAPEGRSDPLNTSDGQDRGEHQGKEPCYACQDLCAGLPVRHLLHCSP